MRLSISMVKILDGRSIAYADVAIGDLLQVADDLEAQLAQAIDHLAGTVEGLVLFLDAPPLTPIPHIDGVVFATKPAGFTQMDNDGRAEVITALLTESGFDSERFEDEDLREAVREGVREGLEPLRRFVAAVEQTMHTVQRTATKMRRDAPAGKSGEGPTT